MGSNMGFDFTNPNASAPAKGVGLSAEQQERLARNRAEALKRKAEHEARAAGAGREASTPTAGGVAGLGGDAGDGTLVATLQELFGYSKFRHEQRDVCEAVLSGRDVCVFWATGSGKSMCYQIPAFHLEKTVFVVSPLISLMNDQVTTINNKVDLGDRASKWQGRPLPPATFLGTAGNAGHEEPALQGLFRLVYVTPEKVASGNFLERVGALARQGKVALIAIDEAHCVSQWGPDFRPSFFDLKQIRNALPTVPLMALTATAVPRVKQDIRDILQLRDPFVSIGSFDRPNLKISVHRKISMSTDLMKLVDTLLRDPSGSTLVYVPTIKETEQVARFLSDKLPTVSVRFYHGSLALDERDNTHTQFLSGEARVVVATQAFGMGIDKPDIRRVVHYGAPKTFEEYYQQIGRAGRDGGPAACDMYCADNDFSKYDQEFYTGKLSDTAKAAVKESTSALRAFANNHEGCRRLSILTFFREVPSWGERCGTCDTCLRQKSGDANLKRDFRLEAAVLLGAVQAYGAKPQSTTKLLNLLGTGDIGIISVTPQERQRLIALRKSLPPATRSDDRLKEMLVSLNTAGFLSRSTQSADIGGFKRSWEVHIVTRKGQDWLSKDEAAREPIMLPMPQVMIDAEREKKRQAAETMAELEAAGVQMDQVPAEEVEEGGGEVMTVLTMWVRTLQRLRNPETSSQGSIERADHLDSVLKEVQQWRDDKAKALRIAPAAVLPDYLAMKIIHARATDKDALVAAGVRIKGVEELAALLQTHFPPAAAASAAEGGEDGGTMVLPEGEFTAKKAWTHAIYKVAKNGKLPAWETSYNRFKNGEHPQAIAVDQELGKPLQSNTIVGHILEALLHARPVDLRRLVQTSGALLPTELEWQRLEEAVLGLGLDVERTAMVSSKDIMLAASGRIDKPPDTKTADDRAVEALWYDRVRWFLSLKRAGVPVRFRDGAVGQAKRQRV